jgi:glucose/arabinose dehydrogenase
LAFGPDGYLYIGMGDGGSGGDPQGNGQNLTALLGKILRIDVDGGDPYAIPADNPFAAPAIRSTDQSKGWRNPVSMELRPSDRRSLCGDVGQNRYGSRLRQTDSPGGGNYGWRLMEETLLQSPITATAALITDPRYARGSTAQ